MADYRWWDRCKVCPVCAINLEIVEVWDLVGNFQFALCHSCKSWSHKNGCMVVVSGWMYCTTCAVLEGLTR